MKKERVWLTIAANSPAWEKDGNGSCAGEKNGLWWRCFIGDDDAPIYLKAFFFAGLAGAGNNATSARPKADQRGVRAEIRCFGDITVDDRQVALIVFRDHSVPEFKIHDPK